MAKENITRSPLVAGFMAVAMGFHSPAGHDAFYQTALRAWFSPAWMSTMSMRTFHLQLLGRDINLQVPLPISFQEFRDNATFYVHHEDMDVFGHRLRLLQDPFSFCLPFVGDDEDKPSAPQNFSACHAATTREDKKIKKGLNVA